MNLLDRELQEYAGTLETDFFGVADLASAYTAIMEQGGQDIARYPRAISLGIALQDSIVDQLPRRAEHAVAVEYRSQAYDIVNQRLDLAVSRLASWLSRRNHLALPIPASKRVDDERICAAFSHKMAAHLAGLGWIGRSCLLVTPQHGPRVRWASVLTAAPLSATGQMMASACGACQECVDICPVQAFTGRVFQPDEPRAARFDARKCDDYLENLEKTNAPGVCGMCLYVCPHGKSS